MLESYMGPTANFAGSNRERQSEGLPGHCVRCAEHGHVKAHPDLGCSDVGCDRFHDEDPTPTDTGTAPAMSPAPQTRLTVEATIARVVAEHEFQSTSTTRGNIVTRHAGCTCDPDIEFTWATRETEHLAHLHAAIYAAGHAQGQIDKAAARA